MVFNFDFCLLFNDSKWNTCTLMSYVTLEDIINFECFENFPNSGFSSLDFPVRKAIGSLPKIAKKNPWISFAVLKKDFRT